MDRAEESSPERAAPRPVPTQGTGVREGAVAGEHGAVRGGEGADGRGGRGHTRTRGESAVGAGMDIPMPSEVSPPRSTGRRGELDAHAAMGSGEHAAGAAGRVSGGGAGGAGVASGTLCVDTAAGATGDAVESGQSPSNTRVLERAGAIGRAHKRRGSTGVPPRPAGRRRSHSGEESDEGMPPRPVRRRSHSGEGGDEGGDGGVVGGARRGVCVDVTREAVASSPGAFAAVAPRPKPVAATRGEEKKKGAVPTPQPSPPSLASLSRLSSGSLDSPAFAGSPAVGASASLDAGNAADDEGVLGGGSDDDDDDDDDATLSPGVTSTGSESVDLSRLARSLPDENAITADGDGSPGGGGGGARHPRRRRTLALVQGRERDSLEMALRYRKRRHSTKGFRSLLRHMKRWRTVLFSPRRGGAGGTGSGAGSGHHHAHHHRRSGTHTTSAGRRVAFRSVDARDRTGSNASSGSVEDWLDATTRAAEEEDSLGSRGSEHGGDVEMAARGGGGVGEGGGVGGVGGVGAVSSDMVDEVDSVFGESVLGDDEDEEYYLTPEELAELAREEELAKIKQKSNLNFDTEQRKKNVMLLAVALAGILVMCIEVGVVAWDGSTVQKNDTTQGVKAIITCFTAVLMYGLWDYYRLQLDVYKVMWDNPSATLWSSGLGWWMLVEMLVCLPHPAPFLDFSLSNERFLSDTTLGSFMFLRMYLVLRVVRDYSSVYVNRREILRSGVLKGIGGLDFDWHLSLRAQFYEHAGVLVPLILLLSILVMSFILYITEREGDHEERYTVGVAMYHTIITMTTVGFGDFFPLSPSGRVAAVMCSFLGLIITSLVVAFVGNQLSLSAHQKAAVEWNREHVFAQHERDYAAHVIQWAWRWYRREQTEEYKNMTPTEKELLRLRRYRPRLHKLVNKLSRYRRLKAVSHVSHRDPTIERMETMEKRLIRVEETQQQVVASLQVIMKKLGVDQSTTKRLSRTASSRFVRTSSMMALHESLGLNASGGPRPRKSSVARPMSTASFRFSRPSSPDGSEHNRSGPFLTPLGAPPPVRMRSRSSAVLRVIPPNS